MVRYCFKMSVKAVAEVLSFRLKATTPSHLTYYLTWGGLKPEIAELSAASGPLISSK